MKPLAPERRRQIEDDRESQVRLKTFLGNRGVKKAAKPPSIADREWAKLMDEACTYARTGKWEDALPKHFVALYDYLHNKVYGVACAELTPTVRFGVSMKAKAMLTREFSENRAAMAEFLRWTWQREDWREKNLSGSRGRIGPWLQFNGAILTDYRLDLARRQKTGTR